MIESGETLFLVWTFLGLCGAALGAFNWTRDLDLSVHGALVFLVSGLVMGPLFLAVAVVLEAFHWAGWLIDRGFKPINGILIKRRKVRK